MRFDNGGYKGQPKIAFATPSGTLVAAMSVAGPDYYEFEICLNDGIKDHRLALAGTTDQVRGSHVYAYDDDHDEPTVVTRDLDNHVATFNDTASMEPIEDKAGLVATLNLALAANDPARYGQLLESPFELIGSKDRCLEFLARGGDAWNVSGDSPAAVMETMAQACLDYEPHLTRPTAEDLIARQDERSER